MKYKTLILMIFSFCFVPVLTFAQHEDEVVAKTKTVSVKQDAPTDISKPLVVTKDTKIITLVFKANPSTGFSWFLGKYDYKFIKPLTHKYVPSQNNMPGASGFSVWKFKVKDNAFAVPQVLQIKMIYMRPFSLDNITRQVVTIVTHNSSHVHKKHSGKKAKKRVKKRK